MASIEMQIITKRQIPKGLIETFNRQTCKDFTMKILTRYPQRWKPKDLRVNFPVRVIPQRLFYSTGTRYALNLARDELLSYAESKYVLSLDDFFVVTPYMVNILRNRLRVDTESEDAIVQSRIHRGGPPWKGPETFRDLFKDVPWGGDWERLFPPWTKLTTKVQLFTGCMLFPMKIVRRINGWDLAYDGAWGSDDGNLFERVRITKTFRYITNYALRAVQLKHPSHEVERDDQPIIPQSQGIFIINKNTGRKLDIRGKQICLRGNPSIPKPRLKSYQMPRDGHARFGLKQVEWLLEG